METLHATALSLGDAAVILRGPSGAGKSDLAFRALTTPLAPLVAGSLQLVADDRVVVTRRGDAVFVQAPDVLRGLIEVRGLGIRTVPFRSEARLVLAVDLVAAHLVPRMPELAHEMLGGCAIETLDLNPFETSAPLKLALALAEAATRRSESSASDDRLF